MVGGTAIRQHLRPLGGQILSRCTSESLELGGQLSQHVVTEAAHGAQGPWMRHKRRRDMELVVQCYAATGTPHGQVRIMHILSA